MASSEALVVSCPHCQTKLQAPIAAAGRIIDCPKCHQPVMVPDLPHQIEPLVEEFIDDGRPLESFLRTTSTGTGSIPSSRSNKFPISKTGPGLAPGIAVPLLLLMLAFEFWAMANAVLAYLLITENQTYSLVIGLLCGLQISSAYGVGRAYVRMKRQGDADVWECYNIAAWTAITGLMALNILAVGLASVLFVNAKTEE